MHFDRVLIAGVMAAPVELKITGRGTHAAKLMVEVRRRYRDSSTGQRMTVSSILPIGVYGEAAKQAHDHLRVGDQVMIEGHHRLESRRDKDSGEPYAILRLAADFVDYLNHPNHKL